MLLSFDRNVINFTISKLILQQQRLALFTQVDAIVNRIWFIALWKKTSCKYILEHVPRSCLWTETNAIILAAVYQFGVLALRNSEKKRWYRAPAPFPAGGCSEGYWTPSGVARSTRWSVTGTHRRRIHRGGFSWWCFVHGFLCQIRNVEGVRGHLVLTKSGRLFTVETEIYFDVHLCILWRRVEKIRG